MQFTYFLVLFFSALSPIIPIIFLNKKTKFLNDFLILIISIFLCSIPLLIWDYLFTKNEIWGFSDDYIFGIKIFNLPIEEISFFYVIPFITIFLYYSYNSIISKYPSKLFSLFFSVILILFLIGLAIFNLDKLYTQVVSVYLAIVLIIALIVNIKVKFIHKFFVMFLISMIPFLIVNGILTRGIRINNPTPVVWYNNNENLGVRIYTIPVEDALYSMIILLGPVTIVEFLKNLDKSYKNRVK